MQHASQRSSAYRRSQLTRLTVLAVGLFASAVVSAHELERAHPWAEQHHPREVTVAVTAGSPPFFTLNGDGGREWVLIESAILATGHHVGRPLYVPLPEALGLYERGLVDAVWLGRASLGMESEHWHLSAPLLPREFVAVTLADRGLTLTSPSDLIGRGVGSLSRATELLGTILQSVIAVDPAHQTCKSHMLLMLMLFDRRLEVAVVERSVFEYYRARLPQSVHPDQPVTYHHIFPLEYPRLVFRDALLRDEFDAALDRIGQSAQSHADRVKSLTTGSLDDPKSISKQ